METLAPRLLRYCLARTGDAGLAEEAAQDALTALVRRWRRYGPPDNADGFAFAIARRRALRALVRRRLLAPLDALGMAHKCQHPGSNTERAIEQRDELQRTLAALSHLGHRDRESILLAAVGELDTAAAAEALGISSSAFKMRLHRARQRLDTLLETDR
ncbi:MAG: sigma-70 family RNA polymerase sigma factor [Acidobacteriota bacterium]